MNRASFGAVVLVAVAALFGLGCAENQAASEKCKGAKSSDDCSACCKQEGSSGHKYLNGVCGCLGGG